MLGKPALKAIPEIEELPVGHDSPVTTLFEWWYGKYGSVSALGERYRFSQIWRFAPS